jgi:hypothetical protein
MVRRRGGQLRHIRFRTANNVHKFIRNRHRSIAPTQNGMGCRSISGEIKRT